MAAATLRRVAWLLLLPVACWSARVTSLSAVKPGTSPPPSRHAIHATQFYDIVHTQRPTVVHLEKWYGRLGNNILSITNAVKLAACCQGLLKLPRKHYFFDVTNRHYSFMDVAVNATLACPADEIRSAFFFVTPLQPVADDVLPAAIVDVFAKCTFDPTDLVHDVVTPLFPRPTALCTRWGTPDCCPPDMHDALVAHVRSEDVFDVNPIPSYFPAPLVYYTTIMQSRPWHKVVLVSTPDAKNPVLPLLAGVLNDTLRTPVDFFSMDLAEDVHMVRCARHLAVSRSTFAVALAPFAPHLATIYAPYGTPCPKKHVAGVSLSFPGYAGETGAWNNTADQKLDMLLQRQVQQTSYQC